MTWEQVLHLHRTLNLDLHWPGERLYQESRAAAIHSTVVDHLF
jgi:hypothetical protein